MARKKKRTVATFHDQSGPFLDVLKRESDRGAVLVAGAWLDEQLSVYLREFFVNDEKVVDEAMRMSVR